ncbi:MAG: twin-arginine translocase TatA/TatE family subunit [Bacillota bacterium]|nr:twin-arginine translocase TatA/TatE family subunit [Bacillota bacterium]MDW7684178.1 twin-arginine translocase TatA/TatE family subunit [Bacillota bacterium]
MFSRIGGIELLLLLVVVLLVFGPKKLPGIGQAIGNGIREFRDASKSVKEEEAEEV